MVMHLHKRGFTLVELLVVISVIALLAGMLVAGIPMIREAVRKSRTGLIVAQVAIGLETTAGERGGYASLVPHPVAAYKAPRSEFRRGSGVSGFTSGDAVDSSAPMPYLTLDTAVAADSAYASLKNRILLPSDVYAGSNPLLFGLNRQKLTIIGSAAGLGSYTRLVPPAQSANVRSEDLVIADNGTLDQLEVQNQRAVELALGPAVISELNTLGALETTKSGTLLADDRMYAKGAVSGTWQPGFMPTGGSWTSYRLRGTAIYDAWGRELLVWSDGKGRIMVESAGKDGVFAFNPGKNQTFDTDPWGSVPAGDDRDGRADNISSAAARK